MPNLPPDLIVASSEGNFLEQVPIFTNILQQLLASPGEAVVRPISSQDQSISFYLDIAGIPMWKALVYDGSDYGLYLEPGYVVIQG